MFLNARREDPEAALVTLSATGNLGDGLSCSVKTGQAIAHAELHRRTTVFDRELPSMETTPWCFELPVPASMTARLYLAWAVTDLRATTLQP